LAGGTQGSTAIVRITRSAGRSKEFRERVRWLLVRDPDADPCTGHHAADHGHLVGVR